MEIELAVLAHPASIFGDLLGLWAHSLGSGSTTIGLEYELNDFSHDSLSTAGCPLVASSLAPLWQRLLQSAADDSVDVDPVFHQLLMVHLRVNKLQGASLPLSSAEVIGEGEAALMTHSSTL